jgi:protein SCO1/2
MMTSRMHQLADQLKDDPDVRLVSFSVDPAHDTPPVLNEFAHRFGAPTKQWIFLTGSPQMVHLVAYSTFHTGDVIGKMDHSTKFALVDKDGYIRGYYSSLSQGDLAQLLQDVAALR